MEYNSKTPTTGESSFFLNKKEVEELYKYLEHNFIPQELEHLHEAIRKIQKYLDNNK